MKRCTILVLFAVHCSTFADTNTNVIPIGLDNQYGNSRDDILQSSGHFQELFRATTLASQWPTPVEITGIAFRIDDGASLSLQATVPLLEIHFSTSSRNPENMSLAYASNKGADESIVFLHNDVSLFAAAGAAVNRFDIQITFDKPFLYDPKLGNLLMYMTAFDGGGQGAQIDAQGYPTLGASPAAYVGNTGPFGDFQVAAYTPVMQFSWVSIPEPSRISLLLIGGIILYGFVRRKYRF